MRKGLLISVFFVALAGCKGKSADSGTDKKEKAPAAKADKGEKAEKAPEKKEGLPDETEALALDEGKSEIPATITVPKGCTTFNDTPTTIRVNFGKHGELFGVQVKKGNEYNTNIEEFAGELARNEYGNTNEVLEKSDSLLAWKVTREGQDGANHEFRLLTKLGDTTWVCTDGNYGGWSQEQMDRQVAACKTLTAK